MGLDRDSIVHTKKALRDKMRVILREYKQPVLVQSFLPGREFNVAIVGGRRLRVMPLAEVNYAELPSGDSAHHVLRGQVHRDFRGV